MTRTSWTIKASKLCNLRCAYCYEWPHLSDATRITIEDWHKVLTEVKWHHGQQVVRTNADYISTIIWHGGEPLTLPLAYWSDVANLQRRLLCDEWGNPLNYRTAIQTNLYRVSGAWLSLFEQEQMLVGVSYDGVSGVRISAKGASTEARVLDNLGLLRERKIPFGGAVVLAGHNRHVLPEIYYQLKSAGAAYVKIIPMFKADQISDSAPFAITRAEVLRALGELYLEWSADPTQIPVFPLSGCERTVRLSQLNFTCGDFDRRNFGEQRLIVDTNADLYTQPGIYGSEHRLGNLRQNSLAEIMASPDYERSLVASDRSRSQLCSECTYRPACDTRAAQSDLNSLDSLDLERCHVKADLCDFIDARLVGSTAVALSLT